MDKPRIRYSEVSFFGVCGNVWICADRFHTGIGGNPRSAYVNWAEDVPKTMLGRFARRCLVRALGDGDGMRLILAVVVAMVAAPLLLALWFS
jgi:hypothetical protein